MIGADVMPLGYMFIGVSIAVPCFLLAATGRWWSPLAGVLLMFFAWKWYVGLMGDVVDFWAWSSVPVPFTVLAALLSERDKATGLLSREARNWAWGFCVVGILLLAGGYFWAIAR